MTQVMVNASENGIVDAATVIPAVSVMSSENSPSKTSIVSENSISNSLIVPEDQLISGERTPSPAGSDLWRNSNDLIIRAEGMLNEGSSPIEVLRTLFPGMRMPPEGWSDGTVMSILAELLDQPPKRNKLPQWNSFEDAIQLFRSCKRILILTGAGVSVSCGIPDFRSKDGIYARLHVDFPDLPDPTAMFDISYFKRNPAPFFDFAQEIFPGQFEPSISHKFIKCLEDNEQLLRNYTQNIDTLEKQTGITRVIECHGSFSKATCLVCHSQFDGDIIKDDVMAKRVSHCPKCKEGLIKPDIVFFGEDLGELFHRQMAIDRDKVDLLVVIGSSLKVRPVSLIPFSVAPEVPQILINREPLANYTADIELLGNCDEIVADICQALGGSFEEMLKKHDERVFGRVAATSSSTDISVVADKEVNASLFNAEKSSNRKRRKMIGQEEFNQIMSQLVDEQNEENDANDDSPSAKKPRLAEMYQRKYISVESQLPSDAYFMVSANRTVFPGAELLYDLDTKTMTKPNYSSRASGGNWFSGESDSEDECEIDMSDERGRRSRACSEEPNRDGTDIEFEIENRPHSCGPSIDLEQRVSATQVKNSIDFGDDESSGDEES